MKPCGGCRNTEQYRLATGLAGIIYTINYTPKRRRKERLQFYSRPYGKLEQVSLSGDFKLRAKHLFFIRKRKAS